MATPKPSGAIHAPSPKRGAGSVNPLLESAPISPMRSALRASGSGFNTNLYQMKICSSSGTLRATSM